MTPLESLLIRRIKANGPISLADYMADCLLHPQHGYYTTRDPFGQGGDFTTAPEISQMFGELIGLCLAQSWLDQGAPARFTLAELGPGRGTLMADLLRATRGVPGFHAAANVTLIEASAPLRTRQRASLGDHPAVWLDGPETLPDAPLFLIANEFFDALPIRQFTRHAQGWCETLVGVRDDHLAFGQSAPTGLGALAHRLADTAPGDIVEICSAATAITAQVSTRIAARGGAALIVDYGGWQSRGDTLQALRAHQFAPPLHAPGTADLTAHVDFAALAQAALPCRTTRLTPQGMLLERLGITQRAARLAQNLTGAALQSHLAATRRLTEPTEMGNLFQALAIHPADQPAPPGFD
ncbi:MAG: SAM-dependent methyltransferase [Paracoccaceae bacterium]|nr:SAM-dependent methyltransferase [Paracoccaceae bacterium]